MKRGLVLVAVVALAAPAASARPDARAQTPGVTPTTILLGGTVPLSGPAAAFGALAPGAFTHLK